MSDLTIQIQQQQATVEYIRMFVNSRKATPEDLAIAERRLAELKELQAGDTPKILPKKAEEQTKITTRDIVQTIVSTPAVSKSVDVVQMGNTSEILPNLLILPLKADLLNQADQLTRQQSELSNRLHEIPKNEKCPELMAEILEIREKIEDIWTKYRYLERNGCLPPEAEAEKKEKSLDLLKALDERKKYWEKRAKLKKKLDDPVKSKNPVNKERWEGELSLVCLEIDRLDDEIKILKLQ